MTGSNTTARTGELVGPQQRIALFTRYLTTGGIQRVMVRLANGFSERGYAVDIVTAKGSGAMATGVNSKIRILNLDSNRVWTALPPLVRYLRSERPDVMLSGEATSNIVATWASLLAGGDTRFVVSIHQNTTLHVQNGLFWYGALIPGLIRTCYPLADRIITVSSGIKEDLATVAPRAERKATVIYNPVVRDDITEKADESPPHPWLADRDEPVILGVGRLVPAKNYEMLIRAFGRLRREREARLLILGEGVLREELQQLIDALGIADRVELHSFVSNPYPYMRHASLLAMSSIYEGLPTVLIEAMACGCPVVSTDCPSGPREILEDGRYGPLVEVGDDIGLAEAMLDTLENPPDSGRLRRRAATFSVDNSVEAYLKMLFPTNGVR